MNYFAGFDHALKFYNEIVNMHRIVIYSQQVKYLIILGIIKYI